MKELLPELEIHVGTDPQLEIGETVSDTISQMDINDNSISQRQPEYRSIGHDCHVKNP